MNVAAFSCCAYFCGAIYTFTQLAKARYDHVFTSALTIVALCLLWPLFWVAVFFDSKIGGL